MFNSYSSNIKNDSVEPILVPRPLHIPQPRRHCGKIFKKKKLNKNLLPYLEKLKR